MQHVGQKHEGQTLLEDSVGQTTALTQSPGLCVLRHSQVAVGRRCNFCGSDTPFREFRVGDTFQDRRQPRHQDAAASGPAPGQQPPQSSQPVPPGEPMDDSPLNCPPPPGTSL